MKKALQFTIMIKVHLRKGEKKPQMCLIAESCQSKEERIKIAACTYKAGN